MKNKACILKTKTENHIGSWLISLYRILLHLRHFRHLPFWVRQVRCVIWRIILSSFEREFSMNYHIPKKQAFVSLSVIILGTRVSDRAYSFLGLDGRGAWTTSNTWRYLYMLYEFLPYELSQGFISSDLPMFYPHFYPTLTRSVPGYTRRWPKNCWKKSKIPNFHLDGLPGLTQNWT